VDTSVRQSAELRRNSRLRCPTGAQENRSVRRMSEAPPENQRSNVKASPKRPVLRSPKRSPRNPNTGRNNAPPKGNRCKQAFGRGELEHFDRNGARETKHDPHHEAKHQNRERRDEVGKWPLSMNFFLFISSPCVRPEFVHPSDFVSDSWPPTHAQYCGEISALSMRTAHWFVIGLPRDLDRRRFVSS